MGSPYDFCVLTGDPVGSPYYQRVAWKVQPG